MTVNPCHASAPLQQLGSVTPLRTAEEYYVNSVGTQVSVVDISGGWLTPSTNYCLISHVATTSS